MTPELKAKWITALRSGDYRQGIGALKRESHNGGESFCCIGVLCEVGGVEAEAGGGYWFYDGSEIELSIELRERFGLTAAHQSTLIQLNDERRDSFAEIADYIEREL
jgi:hypothetical protein